MRRLTLRDGAGFVMGWVGKVVVNYPEAFMMRCAEDGVEMGNVTSPGDPYDPLIIDSGPLLRLWRGTKHTPASRSAPLQETRLLTDGPRCPWKWCARLTRSVSAVAVMMMMVVVCVV